MADFSYTQNDELHKLNNQVVSACSDCERLHNN